MISYLDTALVLINGLGVMALTAMAFGQIERMEYSAVIRSALQGFVFGLGAIVAMLSPLHVADGVIIDARGIFVGLAGAFGGAPGAAVAVLLAGTARLVVGGQGAISGLCGIFLAGLAGLMWRRIYWEAGRHDWRALLVLGFMIPTSLVALLLLPDGLGLMLLRTSGPILVVASVFAAVALGTFIQREVGLVRGERLLRAEATTDPLTGLLNRRSFEARVADTLSSQNMACAMLALDIDHFKLVNDQYGHDVGDGVLRRVADILTVSVRQLDAVGRIGGEEFAVFLPGITLHQAREVAGRIRKSVEGAKAQDPPVTVSIGLNWLPEPSDLRALMAAADAALYAAKNSGRNRVIFSSLAPA
jgi:diguanylate cyclase